MATLNRGFRPLDSYISHCELVSLGVVAHAIASLA